MTGKVHVSLGIYIGITGALFLNEGVDCQAGFLLGSIIGSAFPDIDSPKSLISQKIPLIPKLVNRVFGHRGFIHSLTLLAIFSVLFYMSNMNGYYKSLEIGFLIGFMAHIIQDLFTKGGVGLLYPFVKKKFKLGFTKSGSILDPIITSVLATIWTLLALFFKV